MDYLTDKKIKQLELTAELLREDIIRMLVKAGSGHSAGPLGIADVFAAMYFHVLDHKPKEPNWPDRDRFVLSAGHLCPIQYAALARSGYFPVEELKTLRQFKSRLQGHPHRGSLPGIETTSGPLGSGLSESCGFALAARMDHKKYHTYCLLSDGEHQEGNTWEAVMFAGKYKLGNLTAIIDRNNIQIDGPTEEVMPLNSLREKYLAFNWHVVEINGHSVTAVISACAEAKAMYEQPTVIIAHTIPGKGVDFMEGDYRWHGIPPGIQNFVGEPSKENQADIALRELRTLRGQIEND